MLTVSFAAAAVWLVQLRNMARRSAAVAGVAEALTPKVQTDALTPRAAARSLLQAFLADVRRAPTSAEV
jgi:hypothetical protein